MRIGNSFSYVASDLSYVALSVSRFFCAPAQNIQSSCKYISLMCSFTQIGPNPFPVNKPKRQPRRRIEIHDFFLQFRYLQNCASILCGTDMYVSPFSIESYKHRMDCMHGSVFSFSCCIVVFMYSYTLHCTYAPIVQGIL